MRAILARATAPPSRRGEEKSGRAADLEKELVALRTSHHQSAAKGATSTPATFLRGIVCV